MNAEQFLDKIAKDEGYHAWMVVITNCERQTISNIAIKAVKRALQQSSNSKMQITKEFVDEMLSTAQHFQNECHELTKEIIERKPKCTVQDATNVWLFKKLAEFEVRLRQLENAVQP